MNRAIFIACALGGPFTVSPDNDQAALLEMRAVQSLGGKRLVQFDAGGQVVAFCSARKEGFSRSGERWTQADWVCSFAPENLGVTPKVRRRRP